MSLIELKNVSKFYNNRCLYENVNININLSDRVVIIGENGVGKTTLLNIMAGVLNVEIGKVKVEKHKVIFLNQLFDFPKNILVDEYINQLFGEMLYIEELIGLKANELSSNTKNSKAMQEYIDLFDKFESKGGYAFLEEIKKFINIFGLGEMMGKKCSELSGGQKQYLRLALSLFSDKEIVFLDEPTSYLESKKIKWLINYIKSSYKTFVIVSHEIFFVQSIASKVIDISNGEICLFPYPYKKYIQEVERHKVKMQQSNKLYDKVISKKIETISKKIEWMGKAENKHRHAVTIKRLQREIEKLEKEKIQFDSNTYSYEYETSSIEVEKQLYIDINKVSKAFGDNSVLKDCSLKLYSDSRIIIVGKNGCGKTTLLKIITGEEKPEKGTISKDKNISIAVVEQDFSCDVNSSIIDYCISKSGKGINVVEEALDKLFDDKKIDLNSKVNFLSGGERKRLEILAKVISDPNILMLDEPTVYMDEYSKNCIIDLIEQFIGGVLIVTHDDDLIEILLQKQFQILCINNGQLVKYEQQEMILH